MVILNKHLSIYVYVYVCGQAVSSLTKQKHRKT